MTKNLITVSGWHRSALLAAAVFCGAALPAFAVEQTVELSPFVVNAKPTSKYQSDDSISGGRIRTSIMDSPQSISVLTREFVNDLGAGRVLEAVRYLPGVTESTLPSVLDRITIRGFQTDGYTLDGFYTTDYQANFDPAVVDRIEVVKGPNALLSPTGVPGGTINIVSKKPKFTQAGYVTIQAGQYDRNRAEFDLTGPFSQGSKLAYRFVASGNYADGYVDRSYRHSYQLNPSVTYQFSPDAQLTVQGEWAYSDATLNDGLPIDPSVGTNTGFSLLNGISPSLSPGEPGEERVDKRQAVWMLFTGKITDNLNMRLAARLSHQTPHATALNYGGNLGGSRDPKTGLWMPGLVYGPGPTYTASPAPIQSRIFPRSGTYNGQRHDRHDVQNDYVYTRDFKSTKTITTAGFAYSYWVPQTNVRNITGASQNIDNIQVGTVPFTYGPVNTATRGKRTSEQFYLAENVNTFNDHLILTAGIANYSYTASTINRAAATPTLYQIDGVKNTKSYGAVYKPNKNISLFYGYSENAVPVLNVDQVIINHVPQLSEGQQKEGGVKFQFFDQKITATVTAYEIVQTAYSVPNPLNATVPPPPVLLPNLYGNRKAKGLEYSISGSITPSLSVIASYTDFTNRDPNDVPFRGTAEQAGAIYVHYDIKTGALKGFSGGIGANYMSRRPGDAASGLAGASTPTNVIPNQPSFYLPAQTLLNLNLAYVRGQFDYRLNVDNLTDKDYIAGSLGRNATYAGLPLNVYGSVTFRF